MDSDFKIIYKVFLEIQFDLDSETTLFSLLATKRICSERGIIILNKGVNSGEYNNSRGI